METGTGVNVFQQVIESRGVVLFVLLVLIGMSLFTWFIIGYKWLFFRRLQGQTRRFLDFFWQSESLERVYDASQELLSCPVARLFAAAYAELGRLNKAAAARGNPGPMKGFENIERVLRRVAQDEASRLERYVPFLATTGSSAPFIGLFGTVWGIMNAFAYISPDRPILQTVTPHIAQALVATAIGLLAAIPAVMAYNYFSSRIKKMGVEMENFSIDFLNILRRHFFKD